MVRLINLCRKLIKNVIKMLFPNYLKSINL